MDGWKLIFEGFDARTEGLREALCTLGNGYFATRGAAAESSADAVHYPATYIAGCYNRLTTDIAGRQVENESLVNVPNWLVLNFRIEDEAWFDLATVELLSFRQELDIQRAVLKRVLRFRDRAGRHTRLEQRRIVSMHQPHLATMQTVIHAEDWQANIEVYSGLDARVENTGVARYSELDGKHLTPVQTVAVDADTVLLEAKTNHSQVHIVQAARARFWRGEEPVPALPAPQQADGYVATGCRTLLDGSHPLRVEKVLAMYTSRDRAISDPAAQACTTACAAAGFEALLAEHEISWRHLWRRFDFAIEHDDAQQQEQAEKILRLHLLHLNQTISPHVMELDAGVPARGLHGEAYRGHIFWDELFVFPLFNLRMPEITRALLRYRYRRLDAARKAAQAAGFTGAMFPWQSGSDGREETQSLHLNPQSGNWLPDNSHLQRHISAAVAYNVWQYYQVTRDTQFLVFYGAEMILEIARFWASITTHNAQRDRYEILGVVGPDEYHDAYPGAAQPGLNNNAYTNVMAVWVLLRALELRHILPSERLDELCERLQLSAGEFDRWDRISRRMHVPFHDDGIISQFDGYDELAEFDWDAYRTRYGNIERLDRILEAEADTPNRYKVSKQADVLMLFYLFSSEELGALLTHLGYSYEYETIPRNIDYYLRRTAHGSSLSRLVHAWVLARSDRPGAWPLFREALESDISDQQGGTTQEGIHVGAMAGTVDLIQRCFTGIETRGDVLWVNPRLPEGLNGLSLKLYYRHHVLSLKVSRQRARISAAPSTEAPIHIGIHNTIFRLGPGEAREFDL